MKAEEIVLLDFLEGKDKRFIIPVFQRNYDWKEEQCLQLFKDIESLTNNEIRHSHFLGTIVFIASDGVEMMNMREYILIDGQQRVTTIMLLLKALYDYSNENNEERYLELKDRINEYLINKYAKEENKIRLKPMKEDNFVFTAIIKNDSRAINKNLNIYKNYSLFLTLLEKSNINPWKIFESIRKLMIVYISLTRRVDDPQLIFESLNSTGLGLSQADLIRNFILMDKEAKVQEVLFEKYWHRIEQLLSSDKISEYIRDFLTMQTRSIPNKNKVYIEFKKYVFSEKIETEYLLEDLLYYAEIYSSLINCTTGDIDIDSRLVKFRKLKVSVCYPFLLELFADYKSFEQFNKNSLIKSLDLLISYLFRRMICEYQTNALNKIFMSLGKEIRAKKDFVNNYYDIIEKILYLKKDSGAFPGDSEFKNYFLTKNMYKFKGVKFLLEEIENNNNNEIVEIDDLSIEHIMPQTLDSKWKAALGQNFNSIHEKYVHNIGNLTLTGYNSKLSNKPYNKKRTIFKESRLRLNSIFDYSLIWNEIEISKRANVLYKYSLNIWKYPDVKKSDIDKFEIKKDIYNLFDEVDVTNTKPKFFTFLGQQYNVSSWKEFFRKTSELLINLDYDKFYSFTKDPDFQGRNYRIISHNQHHRSPVEISENIFIEGNLNANATLNYIKLIFEKYDLLDTDFTYFFK